MRHPGRARSLPGSSCLHPFLPPSSVKACSPWWFPVKCLPHRRVGCFSLRAAPPLALTGLPRGRLPCELLKGTGRTVFVIDSSGSNTQVNNQHFLMNEKLKVIYELLLFTWIGEHGGEACSGRAVSRTLEPRRSTAREGGVDGAAPPRSRLPGLRGREGAGAEEGRLGPGPNYTAVRVRKAGQSSLFFANNRPLNPIKKWTPTSSSCCSRWRPRKTSC